MKTHKLSSATKKQLNRDAIASICIGLNNPFSLSCYIQLKYNEVVEHLDLSPYDFCDPVSYLAYAEVVALTKKNIAYAKFDSESAKNRCIAKWEEAEAQCLSTNLRFPDEMKNSFSSRTFFESVRHYCHLILGDLEVGEIDFGPGSSFMLEGAGADYISKLQAKPECTPAAHHLVVRAVLEQLPAYAISSGMVIRERTDVRLGDCNLFLVSGCRFSTVPKTVKIDRPIGIEPLGNMLLQKGIGNAIKAKLKKFGLDINSRADLHRTIIKTWDPSVFATLDLASASDTISTSVVKFLLPEEWFFYLDKIRSRRIWLPHKNAWHELEKFSSMGNGFTFELETLIFYSILLAARYFDGKPSDFVSAFGDDMICPPHLVPLVIKNLEVAGFTLNMEKSFWTGPFRESCGADSWFEGRNIDVRPYYLRVSPKTDGITYLIELFHSVYRMAWFGELSNLLDFRYRDALKRIASEARKRKIPVVPRGYPPASGIYPVQGEKIHSRGKILVRKYGRRVIPRLLHVDLTCALYGISSSGLITRGAVFCYVERHSSFRSYDRRENAWY